MKISKLLTSVSLVLASLTSFSQTNWILGGNTGAGTNNQIGTNDNTDLKIETNNETRISVGNNGRIVIGNSTTPSDITQSNAGDFIFSGVVPGEIYFMQSTLGAQMGKVWAQYNGFVPQLCLGTFNGTPRMVITDDGNTTSPKSFVGIGTIAPTQAIQIGNNWRFGDASTYSNGHVYMGYNLNTVFSGSSAGTQAHSSSLATAGVVLHTDGSISFISAKAASNAAVNGVGTVMVIGPDGNVRIGKDPDASHPKGAWDVVASKNFSLFVGGGILTDKVKVAVQGTADWADFVFDSTYCLKSLDELENFIYKNKHLPDVPSANDVVNNGIDLTKMDATLLQKIEELTLYVISLKKENEVYSNELRQLSAAITSNNAGINNKKDEN